MPPIRSGALAGPMFRQDEAESYDMTLDRTSWACVVVPRLVVYVSRLHANELNRARLIGSIIRFAMLSSCAIRVPAAAHMDV